MFLKPGSYIMGSANAARSSASMSMLHTSLWSFFQSLHAFHEMISKSNGWIECDTNILWQVAPQYCILLQLAHWAVEGRSQPRRPHISFEHMFSRVLNPRHAPFFQMVSPAGKPSVCITITASGGNLEPISNSGRKDRGRGI
jgi:hypothetical protein